MYGRSGPRSESLLSSVSVTKVVPEIMNSDVSDMFALAGSRYHEC